MHGRTLTTGTKIRQGETPDRQWLGSLSRSASNLSAPVLHPESSTMESLIYPYPYLFPQEMHHHTLWYSVPHSTLFYRGFTPPGPFVTTPKKGPSPESPTGNLCVWLLFDLNPTPPNDISFRPLTCREVLADTIAGGITLQDEVGLQVLPKYGQLDSEFDSKGDIHCEATLKDKLASSSR